MSKIRLLKGGSIQPAFDKNGLSHQPMMENANAEAKLYECVLKAGCTWQPELFPFRKKIQMFFFTNETGYIQSETQVWKIEQAVFVPDYDREAITIHAGKEDLHFLHIVGDLNDYDRATMERWCIKLPRYRNFHQCVQYTEGFTGDAGSNVTSRLLVEGRGCGRWSMAGTTEKARPSLVNTFISIWFSGTMYCRMVSLPTLPGEQERIWVPVLCPIRKQIRLTDPRHQPGKRSTISGWNWPQTAIPKGPDGFPGL